MRASKRLGMHTRTRARNQTYIYTRILKHTHARTYPRTCAHTLSKSFARVNLLMYYFHYYAHEKNYSSAKRVLYFGI